MSEGETLILKKIFTRICFNEKIVENDSEGFILTSNFYTSENKAAILATEKRNPEGKASVQTEWMETKKQENTTTKQLVTRKIDAN